MERNSRLQIDPSTLLPSIQSFGELSEFLRGAMADEDSRQLSESMGVLASHIEAIIAGLRLSRARASVAPMLMDLLTVLRAHRALLLELSTSWRGLYEYAAYLQALNNFRVLIGQWLLDGSASRDELPLSADDFQLVAWRTLGEGILLIDVYEQWFSAEQGPGGSMDTADAPTRPQPTEPLGPLEEPQVERAMAWWKKLRL